jgi:hypothetical protein
MPPILLLLILVVVSMAVLSASRWRQHQQRRVLHRLAVESRLHFSRTDQLRLAPRLAEALPVPGAAGISVSNLIYGSGAGVHRYVFTVEYTVGVMHRRERVRRAAAFSEPRERCGTGTATPCLALAPEELPMPEQYRTLLQDRASLPAEQPRPAERSF